MKTPVVLIIFNRPEKTQKILEVIREAKPSKLLVVADGPRPERPGEIDLCNATRSIIEQIDWKCEVLKKYSDVNLGCALSPARGISWAFDQVEEAIILEDDCIPELTFFRFCEEMLDRYRFDQRVMHISGNNYHPNVQRSEYSYFFSRYTLAWGWATWKRAWEKFDFEMKHWNEIKELGYLKDILVDERLARNWTKSFQFVYDGNLDCWDFQWLFSCWSQNGLSIIPSANLVSNIGSGSDATHTDKDNQCLHRSTKPLSFPLKHPPFVIRDAQADHLIQTTMFNYYAPLPERVKAKIIKGMKAAGILQASPSSL